MRVALHTNRDAERRQSPDAERPMAVQSLCAEREPSPARGTVSPFVSPGRFRPGWCRGSKTFQVADLGGFLSLEFPCFSWGRVQNLSDSPASRVGGRYSRTYTRSQHAPVSRSSRHVV